MRLPEGRWKEVLVFFAVFYLQLDHRALLPTISPLLESLVPVVLDLGQQGFSDKGEGADIVLLDRI